MYNNADSSRIVATYGVTRKARRKHPTDFIPTHENNPHQRFCHSQPFHYGFVHTNAFSVARDTPCNFGSRVTAVATFKRRFLRRSVCARAERHFANCITRSDTVCLLDADLSLSLPGDSTTRHKNYVTRVSKRWTKRELTRRRFASFR